MRLASPRLLLLAVALLAPFSASARDPWFPDGPVQPQIPHGVLLPPKVRTPQFPLKSARTLHSDAEIAQLRANIAQYPTAAALAKACLAEAGYWMAWSDQDLHDLVTTAEVPRAVELCNAGCPIHGRKIYEGINGSSYPWIVDPKLPFKVKCPIGGEVYPSNDYAAYYRSGFKDKASLKGPYVDDGWGWVAPDGQRYWFVAHANHLVWEGPGLDSRCLVNAVQSLGRAYLITGDRAYAHKAAILLHRIAEVYPNMNHEQQSRFGQLMAETGTRYTGKIVNAIWEAYQITPELCEGYDAIWETIDGDTALQKFYGKTGDQIRANIEANYLEEAIDAYFADKIRGNYGTHQRALLLLAVVRQHGDNARYVAEVLHRPEGHLLRIGLDYALYNSVFRDGAPHESPDYNFVWIKIFAESAPLLKKLGYDIAQLPRLKRMFDAPLDYITTGRHSAPLGDSRNRYAPVIGDDAITYQTGLKLYGDPRYAAFLGGIGATGDKSFGTFDALFSPALTALAAGADGRVLPPQPSRILSGYGSAILNNPADTRSVVLFYGPHVAHYHHDRLHFDLFANGQDMMPDLGYPDGANEFNSSIFTWSKTSISHNTVTVDAHRQPANPPGHLELFADGPFARALVADGNGTYPQTTTYRRTLVMVDVPDTATAKNRGYVVDFFDVAGGHQHDYSLHGPTGKFTAIGGKWSAPEPGTLAGPNVKVGELYDDPVRGAKDFKGSYLNYEGSGFQHLVNVQRLQGLEPGHDSVIAEYVHDKDPNARLRIRVLPDVGGQLIIADARVSPIKYPELVKYVIARHIDPHNGRKFSNSIVSVLEPFSTEPFIKTVERLDVLPPNVVTVTRNDGERDIIIYGNFVAQPTGCALVNAPVLATDAVVAVVTLDAKGDPTRAFFSGGSFFEIGERRLTAHGLEGRITSIDQESDRFRVQPASGSTFPDFASLPGRVLHLSSSLRQTVHTITAAQREGDELVLTVKDDLRVGLIHVDSVEGATVHSKTALRIFPVYRGTTLCNAAGVALGTVLEAKGSGDLTLTAPPTGKITPGEDLWLVDAAVGEQVRLPAVLSWSK